MFVINFFFFGFVQTCNLCVCMSLWFAWCIFYNIYFHGMFPIFISFVDRLDIALGGSLKLLFPLSTFYFVFLLVQFIYYLQLLFMLTYSPLCIRMKNKWCLWCFAIISYTYTSLAPKKFKFSIIFECAAPIEEIPKAICSSCFLASRWRCIKTATQSHQLYFSSDTLCRKFDSLRFAWEWIKMSNLAPSNCQDCSV